MLNEDNLKLDRKLSEKENNDTKTWRDQPIDQIEPNLTACLDKVRVKVVCWLMYTRMRTPSSTTRLPSSPITGRSSRQTSCLILVASYDKHEVLGAYSNPGTPLGSISLSLVTSGHHKLFKVYIH